MEDRFRSPLTEWPENSTLTVGATIRSYAGNMGTFSRMEKGYGTTGRERSLIESLAERAGISDSSLRDIECGNRNPTEPASGSHCGELGLRSTRFEGDQTQGSLFSSKHRLQKQPAWSPGDQENDLMEVWPMTETLTPSIFAEKSAARNERIRKNRWNHIFSCMDAKNAYTASHRSDGIPEAVRSRHLPFR